MSDVNHLSLPTPFYSVLVSISVLMALSTVFHSIISPDNSPFCDCSCCLISALLALSTVYLFMKVSFSPDIFPSGWLGSEHQLTNQLILVSSSGMGRDAHSLMFSNQHFIFRPQRHQPSKVPGRMVLGRLLWCVTSPNYASFCLLTVVRRGSCGPTRELILLHIQSLVLRSKEEILSGISLRRFSQACPVQHRLYK